MKFELHIKVESNNLVAIDLLANNCDVSKQKLKQAMQKGAVWLTKLKSTRRIRRAKLPLPKGSELHLYYDDHILSKTPEAPVLIADEIKYSVWYKPNGILSQGSRFGDHFAISRQVEVDFRQPTHIVHRLDKEASGLIILAHSKQMSSSLSSLFQKRLIDKIYRVGVCKPVLEDLPWSIESPIDGKYAQTIVLAQNKIGDIYWLDIKIITGRKHQIRKHLVGHGFPIIGDNLYGGIESKNGMLLQSYKLKFLSPLTSKFVEYSLPLHLFK